jgi:hypothetical protein
MRRVLRDWKRLGWATLLILLIAALCGCSHTPSAVSDRAISDGRKVFELREITPEQACAFLSKLSLGTTSILPGRNAVAVTGSVSDLHRAAIFLALMDTRTPYVVEALAPVAQARTIPSNERIAEAVGGVAIGTFANPPDKGERQRAIIDIHGASVVAVIPAAVSRELLAFVQGGPEGLRQVRGEIEPVTPARAETVAIGRSDEVERKQAEPAKPPLAEQSAPTTTPVVPLGLPKGPPPDTRKAVAESQEAVEPEPAGAVQEEPSEKPQAAVEPRESVQPGGECVPQPQAGTGRITVPTRNKTVPSVRPTSKVELAWLPNAEDVLQLDLPERLEMVQLLDLAAEYLRLDYMCDLEKVRGQTVSLRLHGKLQGEIRVRDLYSLLESVLKFKGFAMTCHKGGLVTIVPVADALQVDPVLIDANDTSTEAGDMVVTRVFDLQYVNAASAVNLLDNMKLSVAVSPLEETQSLIVTCYAYRMTRIERLLDMIDRPGKPKEFRFRQLRYTMAGSLAKKVETIVTEGEKGTFHSLGG